MKRTTVRDLRFNFKKVERLLKAGEEVEVTKRNGVIARLVPAASTRPEMPDFMGRMRAMFGDKVFEPSNADLIAEARDRF